MPVLIDGHNLIGRLPQLSLQDPDDEERLIRLLQSYRARTGKKITVVFDPGVTFALPQARSRGGVTVVFAPQGSSADAVIARRVRRSTTPQEWTVVTSDRALAESVSRQGAHVQDAGAFAGELVEPEVDLPDWKDTPLSPEDVEEWLALFGSDG